MRPALQGHGILRGCSALPSRSLSLAAALVAGCGSDSTAENAATNTNATASTNDDTGSSSPAEGRAAAGRGVRLVKVGDFDSPLYVTAPPGDRRRIFVVEQAGEIVVVRGGKPVAKPFLDIRSKVTAGGEQGLLSMAFAPDYAQSGLFYVYYTEKSGTETIWEYHRASDDSANAGSARLVLRMEDPEPNHNGGLMVFGPDKLMYVGTGDGGGGNDQHGARGNAQSLSSPLGKILRIDPRASGGRPYTIPSSNPFVGRAGARGEIYSYGLRNPWRFSFDRANGNLVIGDVGQDEVEEIDFVTKGRGARDELRLAPVGGPAAQLRGAGAGRGLPRHHPHPPGGLLLDHGRLRRPRPRRARAVRPLRLRRLLQLAACAWPRCTPGACRAARCPCPRSPASRRSARTPPGAST